MYNSWEYVLRTVCISGMTLPVQCERGFYCPSASANQHPCPAGTYGNASGLIEKWQCSPCDPGMYCNGTGKIQPVYQCCQ